MTRPIDDRIASNPAILGGKPVIAGTPIPVSLIVNLLSHGYDVERIMQAYPTLAPDDVVSVASYVARNGENRQSSRNGGPV